MGKRANWVAIKTKALTILLPVSAGISIATGVLLAQTFKLTVTKPWFGAQNVDVTAPRWLRGGIPLGDFQLPATRIFIIVLTIACLLGVYWFLNKSLWGLRIRAVTQNRR